MQSKNSKTIYQLQVKYKENDAWYVAQSAGSTIEDVIEKYTNSFVSEHTKAHWLKHNEYRIVKIVTETEIIGTLDKVGNIMSEMSVA